MVLTDMHLLCEVVKERIAAMGFGVTTQDAQDENFMYLLVYNQNNSFLSCHLRVCEGGLHASWSEVTGQNPSPVQVSILFAETLDPLQSLCELLASLRGRVL